MTFKPNKRRAFTLIETLAAMMFLAIVVPVALEGIRVASRAGEVAQRKMIAVRIANTKLNELKVTGQLQNGGQGGVIEDRGVSYRWSIKDEPWTEDPTTPMTVASLDVAFTVQGRSYDVSLSTLISSQTQL
jgi:type II secretory pathway pseudopilin PulG